MILDDVRAALESVDPRVLYGAVPMRLLEDEPWDYTVFRRASVLLAPTKTGLTDVVEVAVVREEFVPDGLAEQVEAAMLSIPGMRRSGDAEFECMVKPGSDDVVEMLAMRFARARKHG